MLGGLRRLQFLTPALPVAVAVAAASLDDGSRCAWGVGGGASRRLRAGSNERAIPCEDGTQVIPWSCPDRESQVKRLRNEKFDVLVIGGGCVGAGTALDAATRGLNVALVERSDFAAGTSGRSTKLIHGGIRYLENAFKKLDRDSLELVDEALSERAFMLKSAPFMAKALPIMIPIYTYWEVPYMWIGAKVYDFVAGKARGLPPSFYMSRDEALFQFPMLEASNLKGAVVYYDGQHNDTRMNLLVALTAAQKGAATTNYVEVLKLLKNNAGAVVGARVKDKLTGEEFNIRAKAVVNATGPFSDGIRKMDDPNVEEIIVPSAGTHVILPDHFSPNRMGLIIPKTKDGRVLFFLPWEGGTICGTTDSESDLTMQPVATDEDVQFILTEANSVLNRVIRRKDVRASWSGIRPLVRLPGTATNGGTAQLSRQHYVEASPSGLVTIAGGKWTTYRRMAQDGVDKVIETHSSLAEAGPCITAKQQLLGADRAGIVVGQKFDRIVVTLREEYHFDKLVSQHLVSNYGTRALQIAQIASKFKLGGRLVPHHPFIEAEVVFAIQQEYAETLTDVIARRLRLAFLDRAAARECMKRVATIMAKERGWTSKQVEQQLKEADAFLVTMEPALQGAQGDE